MATLTGKIADVTGRAPDSISSITVKAPSVRVGGGTDLIVSSPATVDFDRSTGDVTISGLTGGLSWLYLEGEGWSDSVALSAAEGMISLVEAIANASSAPGIIDYLRLLADFKTRFDETAQDAVDVAIDTRMDAKADASTVDDLAAVTTGITGVARRNSRRIQELVSELATKPDNSDNIDELSALVASALGVGKRNDTQIRQLVAELAGKVDQSTLTASLVTKADKADLSALTTNTLDALEAQDADIQTAMTTASTASTTAQNAEARVAAVEAVADLAPESPVDGQTASLISQPDSLTNAAVTAAIGAAFKEDPAGSGLYTIII